MPEPRPINVDELDPKMNTVLVQDSGSMGKLRLWCEDLLKKPVPIVGIDTETNITPDFWDRRVRTIQIGDKDAQFVVDLLALAGSTDRLVETQGQYGKNSQGVYDELFGILDPVLCDNKVLKVGQNLSFEYEVFEWNFGRRIWHLYSTDLAERVIQAGSISLKNYPAFSMAAIMQRYFNVIVDKSEQTEFNLTDPLTPKQILYAALDCRLPLSMRQAQLIVLSRDQLLTTAQIENDAIGTFVDMHLVGQNLDDERWMRRLESVKQRRVEELKEIDRWMIPVVGRKDQPFDQETFNNLEKTWRENFEVATPHEMYRAKKLREEKNKDKKALIREELEALKRLRAASKQEARQAFYTARKERREFLELVEKCDGEALINLNSNEQLLKALQKLQGLKNLASTADDDLLRYNDHPVIKTLRSFKKGKKDTGTYGIQWTLRWTTKPCSEEGWRHPGDGRLHCTYNQLEAETGRTSSSKPNAQNLPKDDEVRWCFICDPPNEKIRISCCCEEEAEYTPGPYVGTSYTCPKCHMPCATKAEENVIVTVDMSGAELRIKNSPVV